ncbi:MAG: ABC transporter permease [Planctomycetota bacterium]
MAMTDWTIIRRSMRARLFSTVTTALTVAVAVALLFTLLVMRDSGRRAFARGSGNMHMLVSADASPMVSVLNSVYYANPPRRFISWAKYQEITRRFPLEFAIATQIGDSFRGQPVLATSPELFTKFQPTPGEPWKFAAGAAMREGEAGLWDVVVGSQAARATGLKMGDKLSLTHGASTSREPGHVHTKFSYTVVGILETTGSAHDRALFCRIEASWLMHAFDRHELEEAREAEAAKAAAIAKGETPKAEEHDHDHEHADEPLPTMADLTDEDRKITGVYLRLITRAGSDVPANLAQVFTMLRSDASIQVAQPAEEINKLMAIVGNVDQILVGMAAVVMVSSGIAIMLALYNSMEQRRRQIAILRVLGCSRPRVFGLVVTEAAIVGMIGAVAGVLLGMGGAAITAEIMRARVGLVIEPMPSVEIVPLLVLGTVLLGAVAGVIPAMMAYGTPVAKNLRPVG